MEVNRENSMMRGWPWCDMWSKLTKKSYKLNHKQARKPGSYASAKLRATKCQGWSVELHNVAKNHKTIDFHVTCGVEIMLISSWCKNPFGNFRERIL